jgi:hypothetical protein
VHEIDPPDGPRRDSQMGSAECSRGVRDALGILPRVLDTSLTIDFPRRPLATVPIVGTCKLMELGRS